MTDSLVAAYMRVNALNMPHFLYYASNGSDYTLCHPVVPVFQLTAVVILDFIQPQRMAMTVAHLFAIHLL
jgi:hypothetical protein